ncbi:MAG: ATP-binding protein [Tepidibacter sp.]|uniref:AAA family ATPase n=1 Tax=Tepidibacter sp. TaxID=2529387 RepID=UPI0025EF0E7C|nr:AAA family ATPase [Tepidibacter sp.]MCT4509583.1 ATP-binding protein [Tepidibacter sp.]
MSENKRKKLPIGEDNFKKLIEGGYYFVDKSEFIIDILREDSSVVLITRPRRFGKTLNISMLKYFLDISQDYRYLFKDLKISKRQTKDIEDMRNNTPIIYLTFKDCKSIDKDGLINSIQNEIVRECTKLFTSEEIKLYELDKLINTTKDLKYAIVNMSKALYTKYNKEVVVLIDEYDTPILSAYEYGYYRDLLPFFSVLYGSGLKGNEYLKRALLTGINRVAKNNIFSGLNNLTVYTVNSSKFSNRFGLVEREVKKLFKHFGIDYSLEIKKYYNGYKFGSNRVFNPWSILSYIHKSSLDPYWVNTANPEILKDKILNLGEDAIVLLNDVLLKDSVLINYDVDNMIFEESNLDTFIGLMVNSGYLTVEQKISYNEGYIKIPNEEVRIAINKLLNSCLLSDGRSTITKMRQSLINQDFDMFNKILEKMLIDNFSYHDMKEYAYHVFMNTLMLNITDIYALHSNLEMGLGRSDIYLKPKISGLKPIIFELKKSKYDKDLQRDAQEGLNQISKKKYDYDIKDCVHIGMAFYGKTVCMARKV